MAKKPTVALSAEVANLKAGLDWARVLQIIQLLIDFFSNMEPVRKDDLKKFAKSKGCTDEEAELCALSCDNLCSAMQLHCALHEHAHTS